MRAHVVSAAGKVVLSYLPEGTRRIIRRQAQPVKYHLLWAGLPRHAARNNIPARSLDRVHTYLRSHYDKELFPRAHPLQNPWVSYFPGLRACPVWDSGEIAWTVFLERAYTQIRLELLGMIGSAELRQHPQDFADKGSWRVKYLYVGGEEQEEAHRLCPNTSAILRTCMPGGPSHQVFFSVLERSSHIAPHCGPVNTRLTCHLGVVVNPDCALRVGTELLSWQDGKCLVFDDSFEHEAWNNSDRDRVVLLIQFWHPDLTDVEVWALNELRPFTTDPEYKEAARGGKKIEDAQKNR